MHANLLSELRMEATIAMRQLIAYREEMRKGRGDARVLAARERLCTEAVHALKQAEKAPAAVA